MQKIMTKLLQAIALSLLLAGAPVVGDIVAPVFTEIAPDSFAVQVAEVAKALPSPIAEVQAGTATINTDSATDARLQTWCQRYMGLATVPNAAQVKACIIKLVNDAITASEFATGTTTIVVPPISQMN